METVSLYRFLNLVDGSWRNAVYVECGFCPYGQNVCGNWLLAVDHDGAPILYEAETFKRQTQQQIDKTECAAVLRMAGAECIWCVTLAQAGKKMEKRVENTRTCRYNDMRRQIT